jgi:glycosyltransferase involved in cell wall biosynthesis
MKHLRIGVDARPLSSRVSGVARVIASVLRELSDDHEFFLYSAQDPHADYAEILSHKKIHWMQGQGLLAWKQGLWFNSALPATLGKENLDLFWGSQQVLPPFLPRIPAVLTFYDLVLLYFPGAMRRIARIQQRAFLNYSVKRASRILCISDQSRLDMIRELGVPEEKTAVSLLGVDPPAKRKKSEQRKPPVNGPFILSVSTLEPRKNYGMLLDAYGQYASHAMARAKPYPLVLVGRRGWESADFYEKLKGMEETGLVHVLDSESDESISDLYEQCAFFVLPSLYEGFGLSLLEAMARGKHCIASDLGCFHEIGGSQITYLGSKDVHAWRDALADAVSKHRSGKLRPTKIKLRDWSWRNTALVHADAFAAVV